MAPQKNETKAAKASRQAGNFTSTRMKERFNAVVNVLSQRPDVLVDVCDFVESKGIRLIGIDAPVPVARKALADAPRSHVAKVPSGLAKQTIVFLIQLNRPSPPPPQYYAHGGLVSIHAID